MIEIMQQIIASLMALIVMMGGSPVTQVSTTTPVVANDIIISEITATSSMATPSTKRDVKVHTRPQFVEKPKGVFKADVTSVTPSAKDEKVKIDKGVIDEVTIPSVQDTEVKYNLVPEKDSPLKKKDSANLEELRTYVLETNPDAVNFRKKMEKATAQELINYLVQNGFTVIEN